MNRLQKKCFIAATGLHLLLALILLVGPAFRSSRPAPKDIQFIDFVPVQVIESSLSGGGNPNANPLPPARSAPPPPTPAPANVVEVREPPKPVQAQTNLKPDPQPAVSERAKPKISLKPVIRSGARSASRPTTDSKADDTRREIAEQFGHAITGLRNNLKPTTGIELRGPGGGGETYAGFEQTILSAYDRAWISPDGMDSSDAVVGVEVTIESDGTVASARIVDPSGDARVDRSVREALERVKTVPVPEGMKRRTFEFNFRSRLKQTI